MRVVVIQLTPGMHETLQSFLENEVKEAETRLQNRIKGCNLGEETYWGATMHNAVDRLVELATLFEAVVAGVTEETGTDEIV